MALDSKIRSQIRTEEATIAAKNYNGLNRESHVIDSSPSHRIGDVMVISYPKESYVYFDPQKTNIVAGVENEELNNTPGEAGKTWMFTLPVGRTAIINSGRKVIHIKA